MIIIPISPQIIYNNLEIIKNNYTQLHLKKCDINVIKILLDGEVSQIIDYFDSQEFENLSKTIGFGGSASVYTAKWMGTTTTYAIKRFCNSSRDDIINEVYLMGKVNCYPNIIKICGVTTLEGEANYSLILKYANSGTLGEYLRENAATFRWEDQLKFANDIASAVLCLHSYQIIHGDLHSGNPRVLFWKLTTRKSPFDFETKNNDPFEIIKIKTNILEGVRERPSPSTNHKFVTLYERCWQCEPHERPEIGQLISELNNIESLVVPCSFSFKEIETTDESHESENEEVNVPCYDCDINKYV
ncbi:unnamed protein product [Rhizophagus irregularis]|nr:unnamed protein product [Rhizophagus irregularis]